MDTKSSDDHSAATVAPQKIRLTKLTAMEFLREADHSGLSLAAFARERGVPANTLYNWRERLRRAEGAGEAAPLVNVTSALSASSEQVALVFPSGVRLVHPQLFSGEELRSITEALGC